MRFLLSAMTRPKRVAKLLRDELARRGITASLPRCQSAVAAMYGYRNWYEMEHSIVANADAVSPFDEAANEAEVARRRAQQTAALIQVFPSAAEAADAIIVAIAPTSGLRRSGAAMGTVVRPEPIELPSWVRVPSGDIEEPYQAVIEGYESGEIGAIPGTLFLLQFAGLYGGRGDEDVGASPQRSMRMAHEAARLGAVSAMYNLGSWFFDRENPERDESTARFWLKTAIDRIELAPKGESHDLSDDEVMRLRRMAKVNLGNIHQYGTETPRDLARALDLYQQAAAEGEPVGQFNCALMLMHGWGCEPDLTKALPHLERAAKAGITRASDMHRELMSALERGVPHILFAWWNMVGGHEEWARMLVLHQLLDARTPFYDLESAIDLAERCLPEGMPKAAVTAATTLIGTDSPRARSVALSIFRAAAETREPTSVANTAIALLLGDQVPRDPVAAERLLRTVVDLDADTLDPDGRHALGRCLSLLGSLLMGEGERSRDPSAALPLYRRAMELGDAEGGFNAGTILDGGLVGRADPEAAAVMYARASALGHVHATTNLGLLHVQERIKDADPDLGLTLLRQSAAKGDDLARQAVRAVERGTAPFSAVVEAQLAWQSFLDEVEGEDEDVEKAARANGAEDDDGGAEEAEGFPFDDPLEMIRMVGGRPNFWPAVFEALKWPHEALATENSMGAPCAILHTKDGAVPAYFVGPTVIPGDEDDDDLVNDILDVLSARHPDQSVLFLNGNYGVCKSGRREFPFLGILLRLDRGAHERKLAMIRSDRPGLDETLDMAGRRLPHTGRDNKDLLAAIEASIPAQGEWL